MLGFFPTPCPDELFYSLVARYQARLNFLRPKELAWEIFASRTSAAVHDLPCRLETFCRQLSLGTLFTPERLIYRHTLYPLYRPFLPVSRAKIIFDDICGEGKGGAIHGAIGAMASGVRMLSFLRFCPSCIDDDRRDFREAYWHRSHQLPGIGLCHKHLVHLMESGVSISSRQHKDTFVPLENAIDRGCHQGCRNLKGDAAEFLAMSAHWLLTHRPAVWGLEELHNRYVELFVRKKFATQFGIIHQKNLVREFIEYFGEYFLEQIGCQLNDESEYNWLSVLARKPRNATHPLRHLLLMKFLGTYPAEFLGDDFVYTKPFGDPPFPCLNPVAPHYLEAVIPEVRITRNTENGSPVGNFSCSCGFAYSRTGPDRIEGDRLKRTRIISMGPLWESRLSELAKNPEVGLREIARRMGVDPVTVKKYPQRKRIRHRFDTASRTEAMIESAKEKHRNRLLEMVQAHPGLTRTELRGLFPGDYTWLYRHDPMWLFAHLPQSSPKRKYKDTRIDWEKRDEEICWKAKAAIEELLTDPAQGKRITKVSVAKKIGFLGLIEKHLDKLPKTRKVLTDAHENVEDFQIRRVQTTVRKLREEGLRIEAWKIIRAAGLRPGFSDKVANEIKTQCMKSYDKFIA